jgi:hypothetical protein
MAERMVTAFRDGVPPPIVHPITVGNADVFAYLSRATTRDSQPNPRQGLAIRGRSGDGLSHCLQWVREEAATRGSATLALTGGFPPDADRMQALVFEKARVGDRTLIDALSDPETRASRSQASSAVEQLTKQLTPGGLQCLQLLFEALNKRDHGTIVELVTWMRGEQVSATWRRRNRLPARAHLSSDLKGLASALITLFAMFGIKGLVVSIDESSPSEISQFADEFRARRLLVIGTSVSSRVDRDDPFLSPLDPSSKRALAILIRDLHVHAYDWKRPGSVSPARLNEWLLAAPDGTTRDFVRYLVGRLDAAHVSA